MSESGQGTLRDVSDAELFGRMAGEKRTTPDGRNAFGEFHRRYERGVQRHVLKVHGTCVGRGEEALEDFVEQVFVQFWQYGLARFDPSVAKTPDGVPKLARKWLANAAAFVAGDWNQATLETLANAVGLELDGCCHRRQTPRSEVLATLEGNARVTQQQQRRAAFSATLDGLGDRDQHLLLDFYRYYDEASGECLVDEEVKPKICEQYGFKNWAAARKAKQRADERLRRAVQHAQVA